MQTVIQCVHVFVQGFGSQNELGDDHGFCFQDSMISLIIYNYDSNEFVESDVSLACPQNR